MRSAFRFDMTAVEDRLGSADREESGDDAERDKSPEQSNVAIYVSIGANVAIAVTKLIAAGVSEARPTMWRPRSHGSRTACKGSARCEVDLRRAHFPTRTAVPTESDRAMKSEERSEVLSVDGRQVRITHPDKPYFSRDVKLTKLDLVRYYLSVASGAIAGIRDRPVVLKRFVNGAEGEPFYQKRAPDSGPTGCER